jgi:hypothetical protein
MGLMLELMHIVEPFVPEDNFVNFKIAVEKLKRYISPGIDQMLAEFF